MIENSNALQPLQEDDEMTLKDLVGKIREYWAEVRKNWRTVVLIMLPFLVWQGYLVWSTPVTYSAKLTFMVDDSSGGRTGFINSFLGDIGLPSGQSNYEKILELAKSMRIAKQAMFARVNIEGKEDYLANHFIRIQKIHEEEWYKKPKDPGQPNLNGFLFTRDSFEKFNRLEFAAFKSIYGILLGDEHHTPLLNTKYNQDSGVMTLSMETRSETLTIDLLQRIFEDLSDYYIQSSTEKEQITYNIIKAKADSLHQLLEGTEQLAAKFRDQNNALVTSLDRLPNERYLRNKSLYSLMYGEALKNLEIADFALRNKTPYVQAIDLPIPPLSGFGYGKKKALMIGLGIGLLIGLFFVLGRKLIREQLNEHQIK